MEDVENKVNTLVNTMMKVLEDHHIRYKSRDSNFLTTILIRDNIKITIDKGVNILNIFYLRKDLNVSVNILQINIVQFMEALGEIFLLNHILHLIRNLGND